MVEKFIMELDLQLNERKVFLSVTRDARVYLAEKGYDKTFGARPMARLIHNEIKQPLANEILFGKLQGGGKVVVDFEDGALKFVVEDDAAKSRLPGSPVSSSSQNDAH